MIPDNPQVYSRPAPPEIYAPKTKEGRAGAMSVPMINVAAAMAVIDQQEHPHALAAAMIPLLDLAQQSRIKKSD